MADLESDFQLSLVALIVIAVGVGGYYAFKAIENVTNDPSNADPDTGSNNGIINGLNGALLPEQFPGGGAVSGSSETFTGSASEILSDPIGSFKSIFGMN